jgi:hypothetical protein
MWLCTLRLLLQVKATSMADFDYTPLIYHAMLTKHINPKVK